MAFTVTIRKNIIPKVRATVTERSIDATRDSGHYMRNYAKNITPVRTGALRESLYVNGPNGESDYFERAAAAKLANPQANIVREQRAKPTEALVSFAVEYGLYLEEGTVHMAPRPILMPASLVAELPFRDAMSKVADGF